MPVPARGLPVAFFGCFDLAVREPRTFLRQVPEQAEERTFDFLAGAHGELGGELAVVEEAVLVLVGVLQHLSDLLAREVELERGQRLG